MVTVAVLFWVDGIRKMLPTAGDLQRRQISLALLRMFTRRAFLTTLGLAAAGTATGARARPAADATPEVISQKTFGDMACGPCALANALVHGDADCRRAFARLEGYDALERVGTIIQRFGTKPSETYHGRRARYEKTGGLTSEDMPFFANDLLSALDLAAVEGRWLNVNAGESGRAHLRRIHGLFSDALAAGMPAVVEVRSFGANTAAEGGAVWNGLQGHWMPVVGLEPATLPEVATGYVCRFANSATGTVIQGYAYAELYRPFTATHGFKLKEDGTQKWEWITGYPYILLQAPELGLDTQKRPWHERTYMSLSYAVSRAAGRP